MSFIWSKRKTTKTKKIYAKLDKNGGKSEKAYAVTVAAIDGLPMFQFKTSNQMIYINVSIFSISFESCTVNLKLKIATDWRRPRLWWNIKIWRDVILINQINSAFLVFFSLVLLLMCECARVTLIFRSSILTSKRTPAKSRIY